MEGRSQPNANRPKNNPTCIKCRNHAFIRSLRNHKENCEYRNCTCHKCTETQQLADKRKQKLLRPALKVNVKKRRVTIEAPASGQHGSSLSSSSNSNGSTFIIDDNSGASRENAGPSSIRDREANTSHLSKETQTDASSEADRDFELYRLKKKLLETENADKEAECRHREYLRERERELYEIKLVWNQEEHELKMGILKNS